MEAGRRPSNWSVVPEDRHPAKGGAIRGHPANGRERQVSGHQHLAGLSQLPQKTDPNARRLFRVVFETILPVGMLEPDLEHGVAGERQPITAGCQADHAVPGSVATGATDDHSWRHLVSLIELP